MLTSLVRRLASSIILICGIVMLGVLLASGTGVPRIASASTLADSPPPTALPGFADLFTTNNSQGLMGGSTVELFGPGSCAVNGDPFTPVLFTNTTAANPYYNMIDPPGVHTFRIAIPPDYPYNLLRVELFDPQTGSLRYSSTQTNMNLAGSPGYSGGDPTVYYPTTVENLSSSLVPIASGNVCPSGTSRQSSCLHGRDAGTAGAIDPNNPFWYVRMDEVRGPCFTSAYDQAYTTQTRFALYYYKRLSSGNVTQVNLAQYTGMADDGSSSSCSSPSHCWYKTALMWVSPGAPASERMPAYDCKQVSGLATANCAGTTPLVGSPAEPATTVDACPAPCSAASNGDFIINLSGSDANGQPGGEADGMYADPDTGMRYIYLDVKGLSGMSENNYSIWAGPALGENPSVSAPSFVNARQIYVLQRAAAGNTVHESAGVTVFGVGHLPLNSLLQSRHQAPLAYFGADYAGSTVTVKVFDADAGAAPPLIFYFDTVPQSTWSACWGNNATQCSTFGSTQAWQYMGVTPDTFGDSCYTAYPSNVSCGMWSDFTFTVPANFDGGRLMSSIQNGGQDTYDVMIVVDPPAAPDLIGPADGAPAPPTPTYSWSAPAGAAGYQFEYADNPGFNSPIYTSGDLDTTSFTPPAQTPGTYYWHVRARNAVNNWGLWSSTRSISIGLPPGMPINFGGSGSSTAIDLYWWADAPGATGYRVEVWDETLNAWTTLVTSGPNPSGYTDTGLSCGQTRTYRLIGFNDYGDSPPLGPLPVSTRTCYPTPPSNLSASKNGMSMIVLMWKDNSDDETGFRIERSPAGENNWSTLVILDRNTAGYNDTGLSCESNYDYRVIATGATVDSPPTDPANGQTLICPPAAPTNLTASVTTPGQVNLTWTDNADNETLFGVQRQAQNSSEWIDMGAVEGPDTTSWTDTGANCSTTFTYRVLAHNDGGNSEWSNLATATTLICPPWPVYGLSATVLSPTQVKLTWQHSLGIARGFRIERSVSDANDWTVLKTNAPGDMAFTDENAPCGPLDYLVIAANEGGDAQPATQVTITAIACEPDAPSGLSATAVARTRIDLAWTDGSSSETGFKIERSTNGTDWTLIKTTAADVTSYRDGGLTCGTSYQYRVTATNVGGDSASAGPATAATFACLNGKPGKPKITVPAKTLVTGDPVVTFGWTAVANADTYRIQIGTSNRFLTLVVDKAGLEEPGYIATLGEGTYYVRVQAVNSQGVAGKWSGARKVTVDITPPPVPGFKATVARTNRPTLTTFRSAGAVRYEFEISSGSGVVIDATVKKPSYKAPKSQTLAPGSYRWRVRAYDRVGNVSDWSAAWNFDVP